MAKELAKWLQDEYEMSNGSIVCKKDYQFEYRGEKVIIPKNSIIVTGYGKKNDRDFIVRCMKKLSHPYILSLVDKFGLKFKDYTYVVKPEPPSYHGYATIYVEDPATDKTVFGDGEVHKETLQNTMVYYAHTMLRKRTEDRAVLRLLGLYQEGFYAEDENLGGEDYYNTDTVNRSLIDYESKIKNLAVRLKYDKNSFKTFVEETLGIKVNTPVVEMEMIERQDQKKIYEKLKEEYESRNSTDK